MRTLWSTEPKYVRVSTKPKYMLTTVYFPNANRNDDTSPPCTDEIYEMLKRARIRNAQCIVSISPSGYAIHCVFIHTTSIPQVRIFYRRRNENEFDFRLWVEQSDDAPSFHNTIGKYSPIPKYIINIFIYILVIGRKTVGKYDVYIGVADRLTNDGEYLWYIRDLVHSKNRTISQRTIGADNLGNNLLEMSGEDV